MVAAIHIVLRKALADAMRTGRLADNVAARLTLPRHAPRRGTQPAMGGRRGCSANETFASSHAPYGSVEWRRERSRSRTAAAPASGV